MNAQRTLAVLFAAGLMATARAEVPPLDPARQKADATDIVTADVLKVETSEQAANVGTDTIYDLEVRVVTCEKGDRCRGGEVLHVRCWRLKTRPSDWVGPTGQWYIPRPGQRIRAYLNGDDLLSPNGVDILIARQYEPELSAKEGQPSDVSAGRLLWMIGVPVLAFLAGFACGTILLFFSRRRLPGAVTTSS